MSMNFCTCHNWLCQYRFFFSCPQTILHPGAVQPAIADTLILPWTLRTDFYLQTGEYPCIQQPSENTASVGRHTPCFIHYISFCRKSKSLLCDIIDNLSAAEPLYTPHFCQKIKYSDRCIMNGTVVTAQTICIISYTPQQFYRNARSFPCII